MILLGKPIHRPFYEKQLIAKPPTVKVRDLPSDFSPNDNSADTKTMRQRHHLSLLFLLSLSVLSASTTLALDDACIPAQDAVDNGLPDLISDSVSNAAGCAPAGEYGQDIFAVSSGQIADRAIAKRKCMTKTFTKRGACNGCFKSAKALLKIRFSGDLFHGVLANAVSLIEDQREATCSSLTQ